MLAKRRALDPQLKAKLDQLIIEKTLKYPKPLRPKQLHLFQTIRSLNEIDTVPLRAWALERGVGVYSTVKLAESWRLVHFIALQKYVEEEPASLDVIIVPLLAFDKNLHRLGYGGGYYDRLSRLYPMAHLVGLAYDFQRVAKLPSEAHDVTLDVIITDKRVYKPPVLKVKSSSYLKT